MAKFKPAGKKKKGGTARPGGAIPCLILVVMGIALMSLLFYGILRSG
jgi:hypothetical protein